MTVEEAKALVISFLLKQDEHALDPSSYDAFPQEVRWGKIVPVFPFTDARPDSVLIDPEGAREVIADAVGGDAVAREVLRELLAKIISGEWGQAAGLTEVRCELIEYGARAHAGLLKPAIRGRKAGKNLVRDDNIRDAIEFLEGRGIQPTKADMTRGICGCAIVASIFSEHGMPIDAEHAKDMWEQRPRDRKSK